MKIKTLKLSIHLLQTPWGKKKKKIEINKVRDGIFFIRLFQLIDLASLLKVENMKQLSSSL